MTIDGAAVRGSDEFQVLNPAHGSVAGQAQACSQSELDQAIKAAPGAWPGWRHDPSLRVQCMLNASAQIGEATDVLSLLLTLEQGKPLAEAGREVAELAAYLRYYAELTPPHKVLQDDDNAQVEVLRQSLGPVAALTPWNFPLVLAG